MVPLTAVSLPSSPSPIVSLVMVVYGRHALARSTLLGLARTIDVDSEVVVVDNASPDGAGARLREEFGGATFLLQDANLGYGTAANLGVLHGRGKYAAILNSDLEFEDGWLSALVSALDRDPCSGAAVPLYLSSPSSVMDAGRLVGVDGVGYGYGEGLAPEAPEVSFARDVDYGSAAALLVRRSAFDQVGGFDPVYGLGYFEDADLGFSLRASGWQTRYVPSARVLHRSGGSFSHSSRQQQSERNRPIFVDRFADALRGRPVIRRPPFDPHRDLIVRDWLTSDRLLLVDATSKLKDYAIDVQRCWPRARVTWVSPARHDSPPFGGVEWVGSVARLDRWLESRRFHYTAVITDDAASDETSAWLDHSQPQALRRSVSTTPDPVVDMRLLGFGSG